MKVKQKNIGECRLKQVKDGQQTHLAHNVLTRSASLGVLNSSGNVPITEMAFPLRTATSSLCLKCVAACGPPSWTAIPPPKSLMRSEAPGP